MSISVFKKSNDAILKQYSFAKVLSASYVAANLLHVLVKADDCFTSFKPGQYAKILCSDGKARAFTVISTPNEGCYLEFHLRPRDYILTTFVPGKTISFQGPLGSCVLDEAEHTPLILFAESLGLAGYKSILDSFALPHSVSLLWFRRQQEQFLYHHDLLNWRKTIDNFKDYSVENLDEAMSCLLSVCGKQLLNAKVCRLYYAGSPATLSRLRESCCFLLSCGKLKLYSDL